MRTSLKLAKSFVALVIKLQEETNSGNKRELTSDEEKVVLDVLRLAGFEADQVKLGILKGRVKIEGEFETYTVNDYCPYTVYFKNVSREFTTGWLDCVYSIIRSSSFRKEDQKDLAKNVAHEIERSMPLAPILLTSEGDCLCEPRPKESCGPYPYLVDHYRDDTECWMGGPIGVHKYCNGWIERHRATKDKDILVCRACILRVYFPHEVNTLGELRKALLAKLEKKI